jgi:hypothetical protein
MGEGIYTLHEFMFQTKGVLYLLGVGFLIGFVLFWGFVHDREKNEE